MSRVSNDESQAVIGACKYVVLCLLQRLDGEHPGLIEDLMEGAEADRLAMLMSNRMDSAAIEIFVHAQSLLMHAGSVSRSSRSGVDEWRDLPQARREQRRPPL